MRKPTVLICSSAEGLPIAKEFALQLESSTRPTLWSESVFLPGKTVTESLTEVADRADFAIFVLTPDVTVGAPKPRLRVPRSNVIFEMGFLAGRIGLPRTIVVLADAGEMELPTDLTGVMYVPLRTHPQTDLPASVAPVAAVIGKAMTDLGLRPERRSELSSCFLSYSWKDKEFAAHLHDDLQAVGVRCWLDAKEIKVADNISEHINRAIQAHDKMLLVLSRFSIRSSWVAMELKKALDLERAREATVLFPIRLDDAVLEAEVTADFGLIRDRQIIDFSDWQDRSQYQKAFSRLVRDLAINASVESERRE